MFEGDARLRFAFQNSLHRLRQLRKCADYSCLNMHRNRLERTTAPSAAILGTVLRKHAEAFDVDKSPIRVVYSHTPFTLHVTGWCELVHTGRL